MSQSLGLAGDPLRLVGLQAAGENLLDQVAAQPALHLRRGSFLGQLESEHCRTVLQGAKTAFVVYGFLIDPDREQSEHLRPCAHRHDVERLRRTARRDPHLAGRRLGQGWRHVDALRHAVRRLPHSSYAVTVHRVKRRACSCERADDLQDRLEPSPIQRQLGEAFVDIVRETDLGQLDLGPPLQLAALEDPGHLSRDGA